jgi:hypothetical protein
LLVCVFFSSLFKHISLYEKEEEEEAAACSIMKIDADVQTHCMIAEGKVSGGLSFTAFGFSHTDKANAGCFAVQGFWNECAAATLELHCLQ